MFKLPIDHFSYNLFVWNFAVVGVTAIFYQHGISPSVTQGYLVCTSVIMAWQVSRKTAPRLQEPSRLFSRRAACARRARGARVVESCSEVSRAPRWARRHTEVLVDGEACY